MGRAATHGYGQGKQIAQKGPDAMQVDSGIPMPPDPIARYRVANPLPETDTVEDTMGALKCSRSTVYRLIDEGELTRIKVFGKTLVIGLRQFIERKAAEARQLRAVS